jgi:hypothetical protein
MRIRVGSSRYVRDRKVSADNRRLVKSAKDRITDIVDRANDRHRSALAVDGIELVLWRRSQAGYFCTCHGNNQTASAIVPPGSIPVSGGESSEEFIQFEQDDDGISVAESKISFSAPDGVITVSLRDDRKARRETELSLKEDLNFTDDPDEEYFKGRRRVTYQNDQGEIEFDETENDFLEEDLPGDFSVDMEDFEDAVGSDDSTARLNRSIEALLLGGEHTPCGICFSTGWTEGYQLFNGRRILLTSHNLTDPGGYVLDKNVYPWVFKASATDTPIAKWTIDLPRFIYAVPRIAAWNNLNLISSLAVKAKFKGTMTFEYLTPALLRSRNGMDNQDTEIEVHIELRPGLSVSSQVFFTHIEIIVESGPRPIGQMPQIENSETFELYEADTQSNIEWPASIGGMQFGSVACDSKNRRAWRIVGVTENKTADSMLFSLETTVTKIQQNEPLERLNLYRERYVTLKNFKGLERSQGSRQSGRNEKK